MSGPAAPMSVFRHYVARCAISHQEVVRVARDGGDPKEVSRLTIAFIGKLHRLETIYNEMGGPAVFGTPWEEIGVAEAARLFP